YFSDIQNYSILDNSKGAFYYSKYDIITISNSIFENIFIKDNVPLIYSNNIILRIKNTTFERVFTNNNYLFNIGRTVKIENSTFSDTINLFNNEECIYEIKNSIFKNSITRNSLPFIIDSKYSKISISNSQFFNLSLSYSLFNEESTLKLNNIELKDIESNSKALIRTIYNNCQINKLFAENIVCSGDSNDSSLILYNSFGDKNALELININIKNCHTNGPLIKIKGDYNEMYINNSTFMNNISYSSIIDNSSKECYGVISSVNFSNNTNNNKYSCGNIHFQNNISAVVLNSNFNNNYNEGNSGVLCYNNISSMTLYINNNKFYNNKSKSGSAIYFSGTNDSEDSEYTYEDVIIKNNIFYNNTAKYFGGAIYSEYNKLYLALSYNNKFLFNKAGNMGGAIFSPHSVDKNLFNLTDDIFENNSVLSNKDDYNSKPAYITLNTKLYNDISINVGDYFPLEFSLYNEFNDLSTDIAKYYSLLTLKLNINKKTIQ
ncbi:hypothetical protein PIROE2DRAFT_5796, partial [Piromyces sp. E2]